MKAEKMIKRRISAIMKAYGVSDRALKGELVATCTDEYRERLAGGAESAELAMQGALAEVTDTVRGQITQKNRFAFALKVSALFFALAILEILTSALFPERYVYSAYMFYNVVACIAAAVIFIYALATFRLRRWYDFVLPLIFFAGRLATAIQVGDIYHYVEPDGYFAARYLFPGAIELMEYFRPGGGAPHELVRTATAVSLDFYIAVIAFAAAAISSVLCACGDIKLPKGKTIEARVARAIAGYGVRGEKFRRERIAACRDEYSARLADGAGEDEALELATAEIGDMVRREVKPKNPFSFALKVSAVYAAAALFEAFAQAGIYGYGTETTLGVLLAVGLLVYCAVTHDLRHWYDWVFVLVLGLCWLIPCAQLFGYAFFPHEYTVSLWYESPFWMKIRYLYPEDGISLWGHNVFNLNMLISFMAFIAALAMWFAARKTTAK